MVTSDCYHIYHEFLRGHFKLSNNQSSRDKKSSYHAWLHFVVMLQPHQTQPTDKDKAMVVTLTSIIGGMIKFTIHGCFSLPWPDWQYFASRWLANTFSSILRRAQIMSTQDASLLLCNHQSRAEASFALTVRWSWSMAPSCHIGISSMTMNCVHSVTTVHNSSINKCRGGPVPGVGAKKLCTEGCLEMHVGKLRHGPPTPSA